MFFMLKAVGPDDGGVDAALIINLYGRGMASRGAERPCDEGMGRR